MSTSSKTFDVVIAGGSYAGLALATALSHETDGDLRVAVVSPEFAGLDPTAPPKDLRASALSRGSINLLSALGAWSELSSHAEPVNSIELTDSALTDSFRPTVLRYDLDRTHSSELDTADDATPAMAILENHRLGTALHRCARASRGVTLIEATSVKDFSVETNALSAVLANGTTLQGQLLVAADGGRSSLRDIAGIKTNGHSYGQSGIITFVTPEHPHNGVAIQHFLPSGPFALLPMTENRICITWSESTDEARRILALDANGFRAELEQRFGGRLGALKTITSPKSWPLALNIARAMIAPRFALIGDAAHALHPIAGQGLNLGFRDVAALTEAITEAARLGLDIGQPDVLETYQRRRRFDNMASGAAFDTLNRVFSSSSTLARSARGAILGAVDRLPAIKSWLVSEAAGDTGDIPPLLRAP